MTSVMSAQGVWVEVVTREGGWEWEWGESCGALGGQRQRWGGRGFRKLPICQAQVVREVWG